MSLSKRATGTSDQQLNEHMRTAVEYNNELKALQSEQTIANSYN